jgi:hypothetical protein
VIDQVDTQSAGIIIELGLGCVDYTPLANIDAGEVNPTCTPGISADAGDAAAD